MKVCGNKTALPGSMILGQQDILYNCVAPSNFARAAADSTSSTRHKHF